MAVRRTAERPETTSLNIIKLYREDLEAIAEAMAEIGNLVIWCDDFEATERGDFGDLPENPDLVTLAASSANPERKIRVDLGPGTAQVVLTHPDTHILGVQTRIEQICRRRRDRLRLRGPSSLKSLAGAIAVFVLFAGAFSYNAHAFLPNRSLLLATIAGVGIMAVFSSVLFGLLRSWEHAKGSATIVNAYSSERPTFLQRTRDDWIVHLIVATVFLILGFIIGWLTSLHGG
jgi:hypothetical protein